MKKITKATLFLVMMLIAAPAFAVSLWNDASDSLYGDRKALFVGDIVTILVNERATAVQNGKTTVKQDEKMSATDGTGFLGKFVNGFGVSGKDEFSADGSTTTGGTLSTTISAEIVEVLPNGNLVIEARKSTVVNEETQTMVLSGVVRPSDINRENMVDSSKIASLDVKYRGKGAIAGRQKPGIMNKIFNVLF